MQRRILNRSHGFSLLETLFALVITMVVAFGVITSIIYSRQSMELDKQRIAAHNYCRQFLEAAETNNSVPPISNVKLVPFNAPGTEDLESVVHVNYHRISGTGSVDYSTTTTPVPGELILCRVRVVWTPPGSWSREQSVSLSSLIRYGTL